MVAAPLAVPEAQPHIRIADLECVPAVALFMQRATAAKADFVLTIEERSGNQGDRAPTRRSTARDRVGRSLGQAPHPEALRTRLEQRLPLLTGGPRDALSASAHCATRLPGATTCSAQGSACSSGVSASSSVVGR